MDLHNFALVVISTLGRPLCKCLLLAVVDLVLPALTNSLGRPGPCHMWSSWIKRFGDDSGHRQIQQVGDVAWNGVQWIGTNVSKGSDPA